MNAFLKKVSIGVACTAVALAHAAKAPRWTVIDLGALGPYGSTATALNDKGDVVGYSYVNGANHAFLWSNGAMRDLGTPPGSPSSSAVGVSDRTRVLGLDWNSNAWTWQEGAWSSVGVHGPADINRPGAITGTYTSGPGLHSYLYKDGVFTDLGTLGGNNTYAASMNDKSMIVGNGELAGCCASHAFLYDGTMHDLGTLGGANSTATGINGHAEVVGGSQDAAGGYKSFIWDSRGGMRLLFDAPGFHYATDINDHGAVIGYIEGKSYLYDGGVLTRLESIPEVIAGGWQQVIPVDINNRGWIAGWAFRGSGYGRAILLIPK